MKTNITTRTINSLTPKDKPFEIRDTTLKGLILRVQPSGITTYYLEYQRGKRVKLGRADAITPFQARELAKVNLSDAYKGEDPAEKKRQSKAQTYIEFLDAVYKDWLIENLRTGEKTYDRLKNSFKEFHTLKLSDIHPFLVEKWRSRRQKEGLKPSSINRELADLRACLKRAKQWQIITKDPLADVKGAKVDHSPNVRYLNAEEEKNLRNALNNREHRARLERKQANQWRKERKYTSYPDLENTVFTDYLKPVVLLSLNTGLRRGELFGIKWVDINFEQKILTVTGYNAKSGKTRHIPLNDEAFNALKDWQSQSSSINGYVFEGRDGKPFHDVRKSWANVLKEAEIISFRWHDLRHTFASKLVMAGVDLNTVRELLGHTDYKMTLRYAHLAPEHKAMAVSKLIPKQKASSIADTK